MKKCLEDYPKGVELMLRIIMDDKTIVVKEAQVQAVIKNLQGRSIRMDVKTYDVSDKRYDVEMQKADSGAKPKRARYNSSLMDANAILPGDDTELLPETYVIFITEYDVLEGNLPIYHIDRTPTAIVGSAIVATAVSTLVAVVFCKIMEGKRRV